MAMELLSLLPLISGSSALGSNRPGGHMASSSKQEHVRGKGGIISACAERIQQQHLLSQRWLRQGDRCEFGGLSGLSSEF